ncbi:MAG: histidine kinase, partial [Saprospiraceae bacterium]|nr:histidine kinase [Saprospiraceae bacterium]
MSIRWRYGLFILAIHLVIGILVFQLLKDNILWFIAAEVLLMSSLILAYKIYKDIIRPFRFLQSGIDALADQDFSIRFRTTGSKTMHQLITVY